MESIFNPWPWYVAGPAIAAILAALVYGGKSFGMSTNLETMCTLGGAGRFAERFRTDWRARQWSLLVMLGAGLGGLIAMWLLDGGAAVPLNPEIAADLQALGLRDAGTAYAPGQLYSADAWSNPMALVMLLGGGFLVGFGARYAGGCTSGHAITGLSNFQLPSLIAAVAFFAGGLATTYTVLPYLLAYLTPAA